MSSIGKRKGHGHGADELSANVHGTSAHPLQHAGFRQRTAGQLAQNQRLFWSDVLQHSENLYLKFLDAGAGEDRSACAVHSRLDVLQWKKGSLGRKGRGHQERRGYRKAMHKLIVALK
jgi:hypothetical protein